MTSSTAPRPTGDRDGANSQTDALAQMRVIVTLLNPLPEGRRMAILRHVLTYLEDHPDCPDCPDCLVYARSLRASKV